MSAAYSPEKDWNSYALSHASVTSQAQSKLFYEASGWLEGRVIDCGCGTAKLAPLLAKRSNITSYTGVDFSPEMITVADQMLSHLERPDFQVIHSSIEQFHTTDMFDSAISIHSYYSWLDPVEVLKAIYQLIRPNGLFILATPSPSLDMEALLDEAAPELLLHPHFKTFCQLNRQFSDNKDAKFETMDTLIGQLRQVGFRIKSCHSNHYLGGVNLILSQRAFGAE